MRISCGEARLRAHCFLSLSLSFRWQPNEEQSEGATKLKKDEKNGDKKKKARGSWSTYLKATPMSSSPPSSPPAIILLCLSAPAALPFLLALGGCSELERGSVLPLLETPPNHRLVLRCTTVHPGSSSDSWCPPHLCLWGSTEPSREEVGWHPSDSWCHTTECWPWTCPVCLPVCSTVCLLCVCLPVCLSVCPSVCYIGCQPAPSAIASLHSFRLLHWPPSTLMTSSLTMFTCTL